MRVSGQLCDAAKTIRNRFKIDPKSCQNASKSNTGGFPDASKTPSRRPREALGLISGRFWRVLGASWGDSGGVSWGVLGLGILIGAPLYWKTLPVQTIEIAHMLTTLTWAARDYSHILFLFRALVSVYMYFGARRDSKKEGATLPILPKTFPKTSRMAQDGPRRFQTCPRALQTSSLVPPGLDFDG